jgi:RNA-binding protein
MSLSKDKIKQLRQIGHALKPVVTVGDNGFSEAVVGELLRALKDHELIKVKIPNEDRAAVVEQLCELTGAELVQRIGNVALVFKAAAKPNPKLSNLLR